jgi:hypothetical protein
MLVAVFDYSYNLAKLQSFDIRILTVNLLIAFNNYYDIYLISSNHCSHMQAIKSIE